MPWLRRIRSRRLSGSILANSPGSGQVGFVVGELNDAILFLEMEPAKDGVRAGFWLSTYGLSPDALSRARQTYETLYRSALGIR